MPVSPLKESSVASSEDLLEQSQSQSNNTIVPETQYDEVPETELQMPPLPAPTLTDGAEVDFSTDHVVGEYDPILDEAAGDFSFADRMRHFIGDDLLINDDSRAAVEKAILLEAGCIVASEHVTGAHDKYNSIVSRYIEAVKSLDDKLFAPTLKDDMIQK